MLKMDGLYESVIKMNIIDKKNGELMTLFRRHANIPDKNMFVTNFILYSLLEAIDLNTVQYDAKVISKAMNAILEFRDKNKEDGVPVYNFWTQRFENNTWTSYPQVLYDIVNSYVDSPEWVRKLIKLLTGKPRGRAPSRASSRARGTYCTIYPAPSPAHLLRRPRCAL